MLFLGNGPSIQKCLGNIQGYTQHAATWEGRHVARVSQAFQINQGMNLRVAKEDLWRFDYHPCRSDRDPCPKWDNLYFGPVIGDCRPGKFASCSDTQLCFPLCVGTRAQMSKSLDLHQQNFACVCWCLCIIHSTLNSYKTWS